MELALMRYKGFTFRCNPTSLEILRDSSLVTYIKPSQGEEKSELSPECRVIRGKGELRGKDCIEEYEKLCKLQAKGGVGVLSLPVVKPFKAYFKKLDMEADVTPDRISFSFEFVEAESFYVKDNTAKLHLVLEGETLFDIAYDFGVSVDSLVKLNPSVKRPDELRVGEEIRVC